MSVHFLNTFSSVQQINFHSVPGRNVSTTQRKTLVLFVSRALYLRGEEAELAGRERGGGGGRVGVSWCVFSSSTSPRRFFLSQNTKTTYLTELFPVKLYVYDISRGLARQLSPLLLGKFIRWMFQETIAYKVFLICRLHCLYRL